MNSPLRPTADNVTAPRTFLRDARPRANPLAICLSAALLAPACWVAPVFAGPGAMLQAKKAALVPAAPARGPSPHTVAAQSWPVLNCDDSGPDSLRDVIQNQAQTGDTVDLTQLPTVCSTITLTSAEIAIAQDDLTLQGPADGTVVISGGGAYRAFHHTGNGNLSVNSLTVSDGYYHAAGNAHGGCIESDNGNVVLTLAVVANCVVASDTGYAEGGGISAQTGGVGLLHSTVSGNEAKSSGRASLGGGIYSRGSTAAKYSVITGNAEHDGPGFYGFGGGISSNSGGSVQGSTIADNTAAYASGVGMSTGTVTITNSTISGNVASVRGALILYPSAGASATIANSTIAFNHEDSATPGAAVFFSGATASNELILQSSILALNTTGAGNTPSDLFMDPGFGVLSATGADNLVVASNVPSPPPGVITLMTNPMLGPLQLNGGLTPTHALLAGSPALGVGNNNASQLCDQRGFGYPRTTGGSVDMGALQFDTIFVSGVDF